VAGDFCSVQPADVTAHQGLGFGVRGVGGQQRDELPVPGGGAGLACQELAYGLDYRTGIADVGKVVAAGQLDQGGARDP
jgi:hypothetical protein